jgi:lysozyme family protein
MTQEHPFSRLKPEYTQLLAAMRVRPECVDEVERMAARLLTYKVRYQQVTNADGVPVVFIAASFEREAGSNFTRNPAQGWPLSSVSRIIPHNGPFHTWFDAAVEAYRINGLDRIGAANWTWELVCFYGEVFNGFGYRDFHHMHSPYLWGGTNIQMPGKYVQDGAFDPSVMDPQLGIIPVARRMAQLDASVALPIPPYVPAPPIASGIGTSVEHRDVTVEWVQKVLVELGHEITVDGNYGRETMRAIEHFQNAWRLTADGIAGSQTIGALKLAVAVLREEKAS